MKNLLKAVRKNIVKLLCLIALFAGSLGVLFYSQSFVRADATLEATLSGDKSKVAPGEQFQYIVTVENKGATDLHNVVVKPAISEKVEYVSGSTTQEVNGETKSVTDAWLDTAVNLGTLTPTQKSYVRFSAKVKADAVVGETAVSQAQIQIDEVADTYQRAYSVEIVSGDQTTTLKGGDFLKVNDNTTQSPRADSVNTVKYHVVEFFATITNTGANTARNVHIRAKLEPGFRKVMNPSFELTANNAPTVSDSVSVVSDVDSILVYKTSYARLKGTTVGDSGKDCESECVVPDVFHVYPYNIGDVRAGETVFVEVKFKADVIPQSVAPVCNSDCGNDSECPNNLMCYKTGDNARGNCRLSTNKTSTTCTPPAPVCDSDCGSNAECPSNLFCYKTGDNARGNCRRVDNEKSSSCQPKAPECSSTCSSNSDCPSNLFCYKQDGQNSGLCRRESNPSSVTCENNNEGGFIVMKYQDDNSSGSRDSEEKGLDWQFQWDLNGDNNWRDYVTYGTKNGEGGRVGGLHDGDKVRIREIGKSGWVATTSTEVSIEIQEGETRTARFGNRPTQPTVTEHKPPKSLPKTGVDILAQMFGSVGVGAFGMYLRRRKTV